MGTTTFVWDPVSDCVLMELDETDNVKAVYTNESRQYGGVLSQRRGNTSHYHHHDALGSTRFLTDSAGNVTDTYLNDAWGNSVASTGTTVNPFRWVGKYGYYTDNSTGQVYVRARMYQPLLARWYSTDPTGFLDGLSIYNYCRCMTQGTVDPSGLLTSTIATGTNANRVFPCSTWRIATYWMNWVISLDKPAKCNGWWVQLIIVRLRYKSCPIWLPCLESECCRIPERSTFDHISMEATRVNAGDLELTTDRWSFNRMPYMGQSAIYYCAHDEKRATSKFFCDSSGVGKAIQAWPNNGAGANPNEPSLQIADYAQIPRWWDTSKAEETEQYDRLVSFRFNCCSSSDRCPSEPAELTNGRDGTLIAV